MDLGMIKYLIFAFFKYKPNNMNLLKSFVDEFKF